MKIPVKTLAARHRPWEIARFLRHLPSFVRLFAGLLRDQRVGGLAKLVLLGAIAYTLSPVDFLSDLIPIAGQLDDVTVLLLASRWFIQLCPRDVVAEHVASIDRSGRWRPFG